MRRLLLLALVCSSALAGCLDFSDGGRYQCDPSTGRDCGDGGTPGGGGGGGGGGTSDGGADAGPDAGMDGGGLPSDAVVIQRRVRFHHADGGTTEVTLGINEALPGRPAPPAFFRADVPGAPLVPLTPTQLPNGDFAITVPAGAEYMVAEGSAATFTTARVLDLGSDEQGRTGVSGSSGTQTLSLLTQNVHSWEQQDDIQLASPESGESGILTPQPPEPIGATTFMGHPFDYRSFMRLTVTSKEGDRVFAWQRRQAPLLEDLNTVCSASMRSMLAQPVDIGFAGIAELRGFFVPLAATDHTFALDSQNFSIAASSLHPTASLDGFSLYVSPVVAPQQYGWVGFLGQELSCSIGNFGVAPNSRTLRYAALPFRKWAFAHLTAIYSYDLLIEGAAYKGGLTAVVGGPEQELLNGTSVSLTLAPPMNVVIDGLPFRSNTQLGGASPILAWSASPDVNHKNAYVLTVFEITLNRTGVWTSSLKARLRTTATTMRVPPGILDSGKKYTFLLASEATQGGGYDPAAAPNRSYLRIRSTATASGVFDVP